MQKKDCCWGHSQGKVKSRLELPGGIYSPEAHPNHRYPLAVRTRHWRYTLHKMCLPCTHQFLWPRMKSGQRDKTQRAPSFRGPRHQVKESKVQNTRGICPEDFKEWFKNKSSYTVIHTKYINLKLTIKIISIYLIA